MPHPPKVFIHGTTVLITSRTEEGLPLVPTPYMNSILLGAIGAALSKYPVKLQDFGFEANHFHMVIEVENPDDVSRFVGYVKQEIAHRVNRLLGRRKRTIWAEGFDSPTLLDAKKFLRKMVYALINPVLDDIVPNMDESPYLSSWKMLKEKIYSIPYKAIPRDEIPKLKDPRRPWLENRRVLDVIEETNGEKGIITIDPYAWKHCFAETKDLSDEEVHKMIIEEIEQGIALNSERRKQEGKTSFPSKEDLQHQSMLKSYEPKKFGKRMLCLASDKATRLQFINFIKYLLSLANQIKDKWKRSIHSDTTEERASFFNSRTLYPPGLYPPGRLPVASILPGAWLY